MNTEGLGRKPMKIAHMNTYLHGGAAIAARRLHDSLVECGMKSKFYYVRGDAPNQTYMQYKKRQTAGMLKKTAQSMWNLSYKLLKYYSLAGRPDWLELFSFPQTDDWNDIGFIEPNPDVLHLHWIAGFIHYPSFFASVPDSLPIVWTLHDMNPFTGGCHYSWECERYRKNCGDCFQLGHPSRHDVSYQNLFIKFKSLRHKNVHIVADSCWLENEARTSFILSEAKSFRTIHYGLDTSTFYPRDKSQSKKELGIDPESTVIGVGADGVNLRRKGISELQKAFNLLKPENVTLVTFGGQVELGIENTKRVQFGFIDSPDWLSVVYSACDIFVIPSLYEAFGQVALEALASGTPVVGFDTGGIPDMVLAGDTGLLAEKRNYEDLAEKIQWMLDNPRERERMGIKARLLVEREYSREKQAEKYTGLYESIAG